MRRRGGAYMCAGLVLVASAAGGARAQSQSFSLLDEPNGGFVPAALSGDGNVIVGRTAIAGRRHPGKVAWRTSRVPIDLTPNASINDTGTATGASYDGSVIVGVLNHPAAEGFRWEGAALEWLGANLANGVSSEGMVMVGAGPNPAAGGRIEAWRRVDAGAIEFLGVLASPSAASAARCVSSDGGFIVGSSTTLAGALCGNVSVGDEAWVWRAPTGPMTGVGRGPAAGGISTFACVSTNGAAAVGTARFCVDGVDDDYPIRRLEALDGSVLMSAWLPPLFPFRGATVSGTDRAGGRIVGSATPPGGTHEVAIVYDLGRGWRTLDAFMDQIGVQRPPELLYTASAVGVSSDGRVITGLAVTTAGVFGYVAEIPVLCPSDLDDGSGTGTPDGGVTIEDLGYFIESFPSGTLRLDLDDGTGTGTPDGGVTIDDLLFFLQRLDLGC